MQAISAEDIVRRIRAENPWWEGDHTVSPFHREMRPRPYLDLFLPLVKTRSVRRAVVLMGPRRVGKTVMIYHAIQSLLDEGVPPKSVCYFSVDHPIYNGLTLEKLLTYFHQASGAGYESEEVYVFFDEIQYLRNWEIHLKSLVDSHRNIKCIASGSAAAALRLKSRESGAGRFTDFLLPPLTFYEYLHLLGKSDLADGPLSGEKPVADQDAGALLVEDLEKLEELDRSFFTTKNIEELNGQFLRYLNFGGYPEVIFSPAIQADPARFIKSDIIVRIPGQGGHDSGIIPVSITK